MTTWTKSKITTQCDSKRLQRRRGKREGGRETIKKNKTKKKTQNKTKIMVIYVHSEKLLSYITADS